MRDQISYPCNWIIFSGNKEKNKTEQNYFEMPLHSKIKVVSWFLDSFEKSKQNCPNGFIMLWCDLECDLEGQSKSKWGMYHGVGQFLMWAIRKHVTRTYYILELKDNKKHNFSIGLRESKQFCNFNVIGPMGNYKINYLNLIWVQIALKILYIWDVSIVSLKVH
jgi:hypothetical protein